MLLAPQEVRLKVRMELAQVVVETGSVREIPGAERTSESCCTFGDGAKMSDEVVTDTVRIR